MKSSNPDMNTEVPIGIQHVTSAVRQDVRVFCWSNNKLGSAIGALWGQAEKKDWGAAKSSSQNSKAALVNHLKLSILSSRRFAPFFIRKPFFSTDTTKLRGVCMSLQFRHILHPPSERVFVFICFLLLMAKRKSPTSVTRSLLLFVSSSRHLPDFNLTYPSCSSPPVSRLSFQIELPKDQGRRVSCYFMTKLAVMAVSPFQPLIFKPSWFIGHLALWEPPEGLSSRFRGGAIKAIGVFLSNAVISTFLKP